MKNLGVPRVKIPSKWKLRVPAHVIVTSCILGPILMAIAWTFVIGVHNGNDFRERTKFRTCCSLWSKHKYRILRNESNARLGAEGLP